jgi:hypothetical protein
LYLVFAPESSRKPRLQPAIPPHEQSHEWLTAAGRAEKLSGEG